MTSFRHLLLVLLAVATSQAAAPSIWFIDPASGSTAGGQTLTIYGNSGSDFSNATVTFGGVPALNVVVSNQGSRITLTTPPTHRAM